MKKVILQSIIIGICATLLFSILINLSQVDLSVEKILSAFIGSTIGSLIGLFIKERKVQI